MMEGRYHATTQNRFYPDMSDVTKNITLEARLISPLSYVLYRMNEKCTSKATEGEFIS